MNCEIWKCIPNYYATYQVSDQGNVRSWEFCPRITKTPHLLKQRKDRKGYYRVKIQNKLTPVHRLVALAFIPNPDNLPQVNHIDGNKSNNLASNLEWCSASQNMIHAVKNGLKKMSDLTDATSKPVVQISRDGSEVIAIFKSVNEAARATGIFESQISDCCNQKLHCITAGGYLWRFRDGV